MRSIIVPEADFAAPTLKNLEIACETLNHCDPDIVHCNGLIGFPLLAALKLSGKPWVQHVHNLDVRPLAEQCTSANIILTVSQFVASWLFSLDIDPAKVRVLPNCVNTVERFVPSSLSRVEARRKLGIPSNGFVILYPARFAKLKRHFVLLSALRQVVQDGHNVHLVLAGEATTEPNLYDELHVFAETNALSQCLTEFSFVRDMPQLYAAADALVFPAEQEPFGLCILEAMAMGIPVIASRSGGIPEFVKHEKTGIRVEPGQPLALTNAILQMISDPILKGEVIHRGT